MVDPLNIFIDEIYDRNPYIKLLDMKLESGNTMNCTFSMELKKEIHGNAHSHAHGGAIASLADTVMGGGCAFLNKKVVTLSLQMNYYSQPILGTKIYGRSKVLHNGRTTVGMEADIQDQEGRLLAKGTGTFFVLGKWVEE